MCLQLSRFVRKYAMVRIVDVVAICPYRCETFDISRQNIAHALARINKKYGLIFTNSLCIRKIENNIRNKQF